MPLERWSQEKQDRMREMQVAVVKALLPFRGNTEPELIACALTTPLYALLRAMPEPFQKQLRDTIIAFLKGKTPPKGAEGSPIWMPDQVM